MMKHLFNGIFQGKTVLVTGHTGFKGSWLSLWLQELGARVVGYSQTPPTIPSNFYLARVGDGMIDIRGDICDYQAFKNAVDHTQPELIFHLAAQPIVLKSFISPKETFEVNAGGTVNVLEAISRSPCVKASVVVTSDKCYENKEWVWGYRENDALGGKDPYSASKSMAELAIASYRASFADFPPIASARAGNMIGGGDFSEHRIIPDCMRALMQGKPIPIRNPKSVRPWLHLFDPLYGYLSLAERLLNEGSRFSGAWNFGPLEHQAIDAQTLVEKVIDLWGEGDWIDVGDINNHGEMKFLRLNWDKAANDLNWRPAYRWQDAIKESVDWFMSYEKYVRNPSAIDMQEVCLAHLYDYVLLIPNGLKCSSIPCL